MPKAYSIKKLSLIEIRISQLFCCQPESDTSVRTYDFLAVFAAAADVFQIPAASDGFHDGEKNHHGFGANSLASGVYRAAIGAAVSVADFFAVPAIPLCMVAAEEAGYFDFKCVFFIIPFFRVNSPKIECRLPGGFFTIIISWRHAQNKGAFG